jgi:hypothetical protein
MAFSETDIVLQISSPVEAQGANGRFQIRGRDGTMTEMVRNADQPTCAPFYADDVDG